MRQRLHCNYPDCDKQPIVKLAYPVSIDKGNWEYTNWCLGHAPKTKELDLCETCQDEAVWEITRREINGFNQSTTYACEEHR